MPAVIVHAEDLTFSAVVNGASRVATIETREVDGIQYVPLLDLVTKLGGGFNLLFSRVQLEINGNTAYVPFNDKVVDGSSARFSLLRPVVRAEQEVLVARTDIPTLFGKGFELVVSDQAGPTASVPISGPGVEPAPIAPIAAPAAPQRDMARPVKTVIIDAGHGGLDRGVTGRSVQESELTLAVANAVRNALGNAGYDAILTREENANRSLSERANFANERNGDLLVSLHAGASFAPNAHGLEVFYPTLAAPDDQSSAARAHPYRDRSQRLAQILAETIRSTAQAEIRGVHGAHLRLYTTVDMPGVMLEMGIVTNPADEALLEKDAYHQSIAQAVLAAVQQFNAETEAP